MNIRKQSGFTIIEVVLVLAIAGLIFLMVFIALPTLQVNTRDTQRRDDLSRFKAQINQFLANNKKVPTAGCNGAANSGTVNDFVTRYMGSNFNDPTTGTAYSCDGAAPTATGHYYYNTGQKCNGESMAANAGARNFAVQMKLEGSGMLCLDNL